MASANINPQHAEYSSVRCGLTNLAGVGQEGMGHCTYTRPHAWEVGVAVPAASVGGDLPPHSSTEVGGGEGDGGGKSEMVTVGVEKGDELTH